MIKTYIFDQDGTLYSKKSKLTNVLRKQTKNWISQKLNLDKRETCQLYERLPQRYPHPYHGFLSLGLIPEYYHREVFDRIDPSCYLCRDERLINLFDRIVSPKFIVTFASLKYSEKLQKALGIEGLIEDSISAIEFPPNYSKFEAYEKVRKELNLNPDNICVVGDNFFTDILPAIENGYVGVLLGKPINNPKNYYCVETIYHIESL